MPSSSLSSNSKTTTTNNNNNHAVASAAALASSSSPFPNRLAPRRENGLSRPYSKAQMVTWFAWPLLVLQFFFFATPNLPLVASCIVSILFALVAVAVVYFAYRTIVANPMDVYLAKHLQQQQQHACNGNKNDDTNNHHQGAACCNPSQSVLPSEPMKQCWICDTQVAEHSMHCKFCNKCVSHFDHHCMWLNTCIGDINYSTFFQTMVWITIMLSIHFAVQCALFIALLIQRSNHDPNGVIRHRANVWFHPNHSHNNYVNSNATVVSLTVIWIIFCIIDVMGLMLILQLLTFHIHLRRKKLSTYLFIVQENQRKREVLRKAGIRRAKRIETLAQARQDGKTWYVWRLRCGGLAVVQRYCPTWCDPLPPDEEEDEIEFGSMPRHSTPSPPTTTTTTNTNMYKNTLGFFGKNPTAGASASNGGFDGGTTSENGAKTTTTFISVPQKSTLHSKEILTPMVVAKSTTNTTTRFDDDDDDHDDKDDNDEEAPPQQ